MEGGRQVLNVAVAFVLAAILGPRAYGLVAIALVFIMFVDLLQRQGMSAALVQRKELNGAHKDTAFWLLMVASSVLFVLAIASAGWWAGVNDVPELQLVIVALSPMIPIRGLSIVQDALLRRDMAFKSLAIRSLAAVTVGGVAGIWTAVIGWGVYALVAQQVTQAVVAAVVLWSVNSWRPRFRFSRRAARDLLGFSTGSFLGSLASFVNNQADALLIGLFFGPYVVGIYRLALRLVETLVSAVLRPVQAIALPELSPYQDDRDEFARRVERLMRLGAVLALPALGVLAGVGPSAALLLGSEWAAAGPVIRILCIVGCMRVLVLVDAPLLQARGSPYIQAGFSAAAAVVSAASFVAAGLLLTGFTASQQAVGIAAARAVVWGIGIGTLHIIIVSRFTSLDLREMTTPILAPLVSGVTAGGAAAAAIAQLGSASPILQTAVGGVIGTSIVFAIGIRFMPDVRAAVTAVWSRRHGAATTS